MSELLRHRPEMRASLIQEKTDLSIRLSQLALRKVLLETMLAETEAECESASERIGAIVEFLGMSEIPVLIEDPRPNR